MFGFTDEIFGVHRRFLGFTDDLWGWQEELEAERGRLVQEHEELVAELAAARQQRQSEKQQVGDPGVPPALCQPRCPPGPVPALMSPQALALQEEERVALAGTLAGLQRSLDEATAELEQRRREVTGHQEKEQVGLGGSQTPP